MADAPRLWAVIPAAGRGRRFGSETPKQYLSLPDGLTVLDHGIRAITADARVEGVMVALARDDRHWSGSVSAREATVMTCQGGAERADSVHLALQALLAGPAHPQDWVLVHDAARPGLPVDALSRLIDHCLKHREGAILALPLRDTLKRCDSQGRVAATLSRDGLWQAQTPQMFPLGRLQAALEQALTAVAQGGSVPTDEAAAMEAAAWPVSVVEGSWRNFKLTFAEDRELLGLLQAVKR